MIYIKKQGSIHNDGDYSKMEQSIGSTTKGDRIQYTEILARALFDVLSAHIAVIDNNGTILATNKAWGDYAVQGGLPPGYDFQGMNYLAVCDDTKGDEKEDAFKVAEGIRALITKQVEEFVYAYPCHCPDSENWFYMRGIRIPHSDPILVVISHEEITALKITEQSLRENKKDLQKQKQDLEEAYAALKVFLKHLENEKQALEKHFLTNVKRLVLPYLEKLKKAYLKPSHKTLVEIIETNLNNIISPLMQNLNDTGIFLSPQEIKVANLVKDGKTSKEIAEILAVSEATVKFHRKNLRIKFGLINKKVNLQAFLMSIK